MSDRTTRLLFSLFLGSALAVACDADTEVSTSRAGGLCTAASSVTRDELEAGGVLCEHQTLAASIRPGDDMKLSFHVLTPGDVEVCFEDDDAELHEVSLHDHVITAGAPCHTVSLSAGEHTIGLRHHVRDASRADPVPDVVHTKWTAPTSTSRGKLTFATNACRGCTLDGAWPPLENGVHGYFGDYTGAHITGGCPSERCRLGGVPGTSSYFDDADLAIASGVGIGIDGERLLVPPYVPPLRPHDTFLRRTKLVFTSDDAYINVFAADLRDARLSGLCFIFAFGSDLTGVDTSACDRTSPWDNLPVLGFVYEGLTDVTTYAAMTRKGFDFLESNVTVPKGQDLAGITLESAPRLIGNPGVSIEGPNFLWPRDEAGRLAMRGVSFEKSTLRYVSFGCLGGGDLEGASFVGATLDHVSLNGCDLRKSRFTGATLTSVTAAGNTSFVGADLTDLTIAGFDVTGASLSDVRLSSAASKPAVGLVARGVTASVLDARGLVTGIDANGGADFTSAVLEKARFEGAQLPRARFVGAELTAASFEGATLSGASFAAATGTAPVFDSAVLEATTEPRSSMVGARFTIPSFRGAKLRGTKLSAARVCGGDFEGASLLGVDLTGTPMPLVSEKLTSGAEQFDCIQIENLDTVVQDATTSCPNGELGPCKDGAWMPTNVTPTCPPGPRKVSGSACSTACECKMLRCIDGACG